MLLICYRQADYQTVNYCFTIHMTTTRLYMYTTIRLTTGPLSDCILLFRYPQGNHQTVCYCSALPFGYTSCPLPDCILVCYQQAHYPTVYYCLSTHRPITRLYITVLLPTYPLPDCILLFCYQQAHDQTKCYCSATHRAITRPYTTPVLPTCPLPDSTCM